MTQDELKLMLKAHDKNERHHTVAETRYWCEQYKLLAQQAIKALAQPVAEPVAWLNRDSVDGLWHVSAFKTDTLEPSIPLYKHPAPQPKQEPVRIMGFNCVCGRRMEVSAEQGVVPAPQRTWVGLTWEEIDECFKITPDQYLPAQIYRRIEAKLKEKNT